MASEHFKIVGLIAPGLIFTIEFVFLPQKYHIACFYLMSWFWGLLQRALLQRLFWSDETLLIEKLTNDYHLWALGKISRRCSIQFWSVKTTFFKYSLWLDFEAYISIRMGSRDVFHVRLRLSEGVRWWNISDRWLVRGHKRIICTKPLILWAWSTFF